MTTKPDRHTNRKTLEIREANVKDRWRSPGQQNLALARFIVAHRSHPKGGPRNETEG
jgi:hypothetical protein